MPVVRPSVFLLIALVFMVTGCVDDPPPPTSEVPVEPEVQEERTLPGQDLKAIEQTACALHMADIPWPASLMRSSLPEGFTLVPWEGDRTGNTGVVVIYSHLCEGPDGRPVGEHYEVYLVEPPADLASPGAHRHGLLTWGVGDDSEHIAAHQDWGLGTRGGTVTLEVTPGPMATGRVIADVGTSSTEFQTEVFSAAAVPTPSMRLFGIDYSSGASVLTGGADVTFSAIGGVQGTGHYLVRTAGAVVYGGAGTGWHASGGQLDIRYAALPSPAS